MLGAYHDPLARAFPPTRDRNEQTYKGPSERERRQPRPLASDADDPWQNAMAGLPAGAPANAPGGSESAVAASALGERLLAAVRQAIEELERLRSAVHNPLPAVPVNRGSFRIS
jgi:hypothetical protein